MRVARPLTADELFDFCAANRDLHIERTADGELIIMPPTGAETGRRNADITAQLVVWSKAQGQGIAFDSSTGFLLPNDAERSPDAAWLLKDRWDALTSEQKRKFAPLCPDFVLELRSPNDRLDEMKAKMAEYIECGARLGWLIDPEERRVYVYRPGTYQVLEAPPLLSGETELPGFVLDLGSIW
jgi:Uma2 family endonuclease